MAGDALVWARDGRDWPNRTASRFVEAAAATWHVQVAGQGPVLLLLHGTGASTHSWRDILPRLAARFTVVAPDLPGHAFTSAPRHKAPTLPGMAAGIGALLRRLDLSPAIVVGHSAGAAIAVRMILDGLASPAGLVSLNGALLPIGGVSGQVFSPLARMLARSHAAAHLLAWWAGDKATVKRMLAQTGSRVDDHGLELYNRLSGNPAHVRGALAMMANWDLADLERRLPALKTPLVLVVGTRDGSVPPADADTIRSRVKGAVIERLRDKGHLAHEEDPAATAELVIHHATTWGVLVQQP